eukprot:gnl/MRDRNA2_/MRDRNA2_28573_c0_seq1.p1 gnl/MRDRNA2_/MRDRNA2_28573_c0~~gnl/MRDRNA2_/MRDRNA2_28573_c0_seq1.p1  ORF type:complete len:612 (-),score=116.09 gnl/MRDRNA2_/MRDRNA2_28573_c0_seq1:59-1894(-)
MPVEHPVTKVNRWKNRNSSTAQAVNTTVVSPPSNAAATCGPSCKAANDKSIDPPSNATAVCGSASKADHDQHERNRAAEATHSAAMDEQVEGENELEVELLTDEQIQQFIVEGFLELLPVEDDHLHQKLFDAASALGRQADSLGNNILPALPELAQVFESRQCRGALTSLLGPGYLMHPHRFCHRSEPGRQAQKWHRDSYWGNWHARNPCPYWLMALYFPQDTPVALGPTGVLPRSQYYNKDAGNKQGPFCAGRYSDDEVKNGVPAKYWQVQERPLACRAGTVVLIHYDLWHRGAANLSNASVRFMFKFQFARMISPSCAPWISGGTEPDWTTFVSEGDDRSLMPVWQGIWDWLCGQAPSESSATAANQKNLLMLARQLTLAHDHNEHLRVAAAWQIRHVVCGDSAMAALLVSELAKHSLLGKGSGMQALEACGSVLLPALLEVSGPAAHSIRATGRMLDANLGINLHTMTVRMLRRFRTAEDPCIRQTVAEALGCGHFCVKEGLDALLQMVGQDTHGDVRATACYSLLRLITMRCLEQSTLDAIQSVALEAVEDRQDRYVAAYAAEILYRLEFRMRSASKPRGHMLHVPPLIRWCSHGNGWEAKAIRHSG